MFLFCSLLSGGADGFIAIHDMHTTAGIPKVTYPLVDSVGRGNRDRHKFSVATIQWYPLDTGMFISSGMDKLLKVWDTNHLSVSFADCRIHFLVGAELAYIFYNSLSVFTWHIFH